MPTVAACTVTRAARTAFLPRLAESVRRQRLDPGTTLAEWVVVDDGGGAEAEIRAAAGDDLHLVYVAGEGPIGKLRNAGNAAASADILVVFDDDDLYPATRVREAVDALESTGKQVAGVSGPIVWDDDLDRFFQYPRLGAKHAVGSTLAYTKAYADAHEHDPEASGSEETSFLDRFTADLVQIDPSKTALVINHGKNHVDKRPHFTKGYVEPDFVREVAGLTMADFDSDATFTDRFRRAPPEETKVADVTYYVGYAAPFAPDGDDLGGAEHALVELAAAWAAAGKSVEIYGPFPRTTVHRGAAFRPAREFVVGVPRKTLVLWRVSGYAAMVHWRPKADRVLVDLHDGHVYPLLEANEDYVDTVMVKSEFHKTTLPEGLRAKARVVPNGVRTDLFGPGPEPRDPYRVCYTSCYTRGLIHLLHFAWPKIKKEEPRAEIHIYYGRTAATKDDKFLTVLNHLLMQPGVCDHGRQSAATVARERRRANVHLYVTGSRQEIDCISIKESAACGCTPVISAEGVFAERDGVHVEGDPVDEETLQATAETVLALMRGDKTWAPEAPPVGWAETAAEWEV